MSEPLVSFLSLSLSYTHTHGNNHSLSLVEAVCFREQHSAERQSGFPSDWLVYLIAQKGNGTHRTMQST